MATHIHKYSVLGIHLSRVPSGETQGNLGDFMFGLTPSMLMLDLICGAQAPMLPLSARVYFTKARPHLHSSFRERIGADPV
jgi:hypothetical protein